MTGIVLYIITGDQQLSHRMVILAEDPVVSVHQFTLTHSGSGLLGGDIIRTLQKTQFTHTHTDRTGGHQDHLMAGVLDIADDLAKLFGTADI